MPDEAIQLVNVMEASGTVATASVYFVLACGLCVAGRLKEALFQVNKMQDIPSRKPDVITFTGLIKSCGKVGRIQDATFLFKHMQHICAPNVRTCNEMIKLYGRNGMFEEAKTIYESIRRGWIDSCIFFYKDNKLHCDSFTFELMLKASAISQQWEYFYKVYKEMLLCGFYLSGKTSLWVMIRVARLKQFNLVDDMISQLQKAGEIPDLQLYEAQVLSCLQEQCFQRALICLDEMIKDGYEIASALKTISNQAQKETWDNFLKQAGSWEPILSCI